MNQLSKSVTKQKEVKLFKQTKITFLNVFIERVVAFMSRSRLHGTSFTAVGKLAHRGLTRKQCHNNHTHQTSLFGMIFYDCPVLHIQTSMLKVVDRQSESRCPCKVVATRH